MVQMNLTVPQAPERSGPVILSEAKDLAAGRDRPFASLRVTRYDCSNGQEHFVQIEPCLRKETRFHAAKGVGSGPRVKRTMPSRATLAMKVGSLSSKDSPVLIAQLSTSKY